MAKHASYSTTMVGRAPLRMHAYVIIRTLYLASIQRDAGAGSLVRIGHEPPKLGVAGSNPAPPATGSLE